VSPARAATVVPIEVSQAFRRKPARMAARSEDGSLSYVRC
jgi:hypothetical protein